MNTRTASEIGTADSRGWVRGALRALDSPLFCALLIVLYVVLCQFIYVDVISNVAALRLVGFEAYEPLPLSGAISIIVALAPLTWLRRRYRAPSDILVFQLYLYVYLPTAIYLTFTTPMPIEMQLKFHLFMLVSMFALELRKFIPLFHLDRLPITLNWFTFGLGVAGITVIGILVYYGEIDSSAFDLDTVYERRADIIADTRHSILLFIANWSSLAIAPLCLYYGFFTKKRWLFAIGLAIAIAAFGVTSFRSHFFTPIFSLGIAICLMIAGARHYAITLIAVAIALCVVPLAWDLYWHGLSSWIVHFRFIGNNGFLSAQYFEFFTDMPKGLYQDSIGRFFVRPQYYQPIAEVVGSYFSMAGNHANANLWADGFGNLGFAGMLFASASAILVCWLLDSLGQDRHPLPLTVMTISLAFAMSNTAVHSSMTSNGGLLALVLLYLMPATKPSPGKG